MWLRLSLIKNLNYSYTHLLRFQVLQNIEHHVRCLVNLKEAAVTLNLSVFSGVRLKWRSQGEVERTDEPRMIQTSTFLFPDPVSVKAADAV